MKLVIYDGRTEEIEKLLKLNKNDAIFVGCDEEIHHCIGCFGCWIKTPGACVIRDHYGDMGRLISECDELIIISQCFYGGFSPFAKNVLDRSISYLHPYFRIRNREMHHKNRYNNVFKHQVIFYGENISDQEKATAEKLVIANGINFNTKETSVLFIHDLSELGE